MAEQLAAEKEVSAGLRKSLQAMRKESGVNEQRL